MKCSYNKLSYPSRFIPSTYRKGSENQQVISYDTETLNGYCRLLANSNGEYILNGTFDEYINFLTDKKHYKDLKTFFNIRYDMNSFLKSLTGDILYPLYVFGRVKYKDIELRYIPSKMFAIKKKNRLYKFYDIYQYCGASLDASSKRYLGKSKKEYDVTNLTEIDFKKDNKEMINYCIQDAVLTAELTQYWKEAFEKIGISFNNPISKALLAETYLIDRVKMPKPCSHPAQMYAYNAYAGGRFELLQRGYIEEVWSYDINSAYPTTIADLPNPFNFQTVRVKEFYPVYDIAYYKVKIKDLVEDLISPTVFKKKNINYYPNVVEQEVFLSQPELKFIDKYKICEYEVIDGYVIVPMDDEKPFSYMRELYDYRKLVEEEHPEIAAVIKTVMNSTYGKFLQITKYNKEVDLFSEEFDNILNGPYMLCKLKYNYHTGYLFNPIFAAHITAKTRIDIIEKAWKQQEHIIGFHTDSVIVDKPIIKTSGGFGGCELKQHGEGLFLMSGVYCIRDEEGSTFKRRGLIRASQQDLFEYFKDYKHHTMLPIPQKRVVTMSDIITKHKKYKITDFNTFVNEVRILRCTGDIKRSWETEPLNFGELLTETYYSQPLTV